MASRPLTDGSVPASADVDISKLDIPQYRRPAVLADRAAAALAMAALAWLVAPAVSNQFSGEDNVLMAKALFV